ncbi:DUF4931 domain-containing protein [Schlesneria sp. T3-172]|uniref:galactose-1-phosphate uridylyltransferase n=1 Tax=Schlesneria sphaerica TaxID=3373610 RepID=UPI0037C9BC99
MPELRKDPLLQRWVVMAPERARRPIQLQLPDPLPPPHPTSPNPEHSADRGTPGCRRRGFRSRSTVRRRHPKVDATAPTTEPPFDPFAEGNEHATPPEVLAYRNPGSQPNQPGWRVRVVPNKFPALEPVGELHPLTGDLYQSLNGFGLHEVIIECPHAETNLARLTLDNIREVLSAYQDRMKAIRNEARLVHVTLFKNNGVRAGASLPHSHSQLIASPVVPVTIVEEIAAARAFYDSRQHSIFDELLRQERLTGERIVFESDRFIAFCPYASRFPYETCLLPKRQQSHYENLQPDDLTDLAYILKVVLCKLDQGLSNPPYNYVIHTAPLNEPELPWYRWHLEIFPRLTSVAGFEWGSGFYINPVFPETAAGQLREIVI